MVNPMKKAQITVFIIIGILILAAGGFVFFSASKSREKSAPDRISSDPLEMHISQCLEKTAKSALIMAGIDGGIKDSQDYIGFFGGKTPYYYGTQDSIVPSLQQVEGYLSDYLNSNLNDCINFSAFPDYKINGQSSTPTGKASINQNYVLFSLDYPLTITKGQTKKELPSLSVKMNSRIKALHNVSSQYIEEHKKNPDYICMTCLVRLGRDNNVFIKTYTLDDTVAYEVIDNTTKLDGREYIYMFAIKYPNT